MIILVAPPTGERSELETHLARRGQGVLTVEPAEAQPARIARSTADALLLDLASPDAIKFLRKYVALEQRIPVICLADRRQPDASSDALRLGALDILARPLRHDEVTIAVSNAREFVRLPERNPDAPIAVPELAGDGVFGTSPAMRDVLGIVRRVAPSRCTVLVVGERGTGREMVARAIHAGSPRGAAPFVKFVCGGVNEIDLSPLFRADLPDEATVYLENIGELPTDLQVGVEEAIARELPVRFIAGAQPRIFEWVERGLVRRDFLDAFSVVRIDLPPLRQRSGDVPLLALHFLKDACRRNDVPPKAFSRSANLLLAALPWPGNAAELQSLCERLAVLVPRGIVLLEDVLANVRFDGAEAKGRPSETLRGARERFERDYVTSALQHHKGRMGAAAKQLGIERTNLYRKIKQLNIRWSGLTD